MSDDKICVIHQHLSKIDIPEHEHAIWQIALPRTAASIQTSWQTATGQQQSKHLLGEQIVIIPANQH
jgi:hypothetical protein